MAQYYFTARSITVSSRRPTERNGKWMENWIKINRCVAIIPMHVIHKNNFHYCFGLPLFITFNNTYVQDAIFIASKWSKTLSFRISSLILWLVCKYWSNLYKYLKCFWICRFYVDVCIFTKLNLSGLHPFKKNVN